MEQLERLELCSFDYRQYEYKDGDVVYCDIPYENTNKYDAPFDTAAFLDWAASRPYPVYISSYEINDPRFTCLWEKEKRVTMASASNSRIATERLYINKHSSP